jgi:acyl-CoA thioesterase II
MVRFLYSFWVIPPTATPSIIDSLQLEALGDRRFRRRPRPGPPQRTYGGEVAGQAILAAGLTVPRGRQIHAAHTYFLLPGDTSLPLEFVVDEVRDGGSFTTRRVDALQSGRTVFTMTASFQALEEGLSHQVPRVESPPPEELPTPEELFAEDDETLAWCRHMTDVTQVDVRFPELPARVSAARGIRAEPRQRAWLRSRRPIGGGDLEHAAALAYISDLLLLSSALGPHEMTLQSGRLQFATINHTIWFHSPIQADEWFLYQQESRWAGGARALAHGEIFDRAGRLCATTMQEGLLRLRG